MKKKDNTYSNIYSKKVSVKANTTDRLGNIGKNKSIACEVIATVSNV
ncbi:MAG: 2-C-methyl-D-erythritol 2,4-cyclodiphosphate synthase [Candidatus Fonsibacter sp.]